MNNLLPLVVAFVIVVVGIWFLMWAAAVIFAARAAKRVHKSLKINFGPESLIFTRPPAGTLYSRYEVRA